MKNSEHLKMIIEKHNRNCTIQVVFTDIEKYSKRRTAKQISVVDSFTQCISEAIEETSHAFLKYTQENNINFYLYLQYFTVSTELASCIQNHVISIDIWYHCTAYTTQK